MFCKQFLANAMHIDWCYHSIHKHSSRSQHIISVLANYMHIYVSTSLPIEPSFFKTISGMHRRPFEGRTLFLSYFFPHLGILFSLVSILFILLSFADDEKSCSKSLRKPCCASSRSENAKSSFISRGSLRFCATKVSLPSRMVTRMQHTRAKPLPPKQRKAAKHAPAPRKLKKIQSRKRQRGGLLGAVKTATDEDCVHMTEDSHTELKEATTVSLPGDSPPPLVTGNGDCGYRIIVTDGNKDGENSLKLLSEAAVSKISENNCNSFAHSLKEDGQTNFVLQEPLSPSSTEVVCSGDSRDIALETSGAIGFCTVPSGYVLTNLTSNLSAGGTTSVISGQAAEGDISSTTRSPWVLKVIPTNSGAHDDLPSSVNIVAARASPRPSNLVHATDELNEKGEPFVSFGNSQVGSNTPVISSDSLDKPSNPPPASGQCLKSMLLDKHSSYQKASSTVLARKSVVFGSRQVDDVEAQPPHRNGEVGRKDGAKGFDCPVCREQFHTKRAFNQHILLHCQVRKETQYLMSL